MKIFSVPINPKMTAQELEGEFLPFLLSHKDYIYDLYFTSRMSPFTQDAMGDIFVNEENELAVVRNALAISKQTGIPLSATFNNVNAPIIPEALENFLQNFAQLYAAGVRTITIPFTHWIPTIKKAYPDVFVKNTILRNVSRPNEVVEAAKAGFDYVNLDRDLMRDQDGIRAMAEAKRFCKETLGKDIKLSLLTNEGCIGNCPLMDEHYQYNNTRDGDQPQYFHSIISLHSCSEWQMTDPAYELKKANLPPWREDWTEMLDLGVDVFKMHGRESVDRLRETMSIIRKFAAGEPIVHDNFDEFLSEKNLVDRPIDAWRKKIKTCKFDCWSCKFCEKVIDARNKTPDPVETVVRAEAKAIIDSLDKAMAHQSGLPPINHDVLALTSAKNLHFLNNLCSTQREGSTYLELGCGTGTTFSAAMFGNKMRGVGFDTFTNTNNAPAVNNKPVLTNSEEIFRANVEGMGIRDFQLAKTLKGLSGTACGVSVVLDDLNNIPLPKRMEIYEAAVRGFNDYVIHITDDANWRNIDDDVEYVLQKFQIRTVYSKRVLNAIEDSSQFWNGLHIRVLKVR